MTGVDNHLTGLGNMRIIMSDNQFGRRGYEGELNQRVETISTILQRNGYRTYMTGKWHLGMEEFNLPVNRGVDKSFTLMETGADSWEKKPDLPHNKTVHYYDKESLSDLPEDFYSSDFYTEKMIEYLNGHNRTEPFFAYLAFTAVHYPHQAPKELTESFVEVYKDGWDLIKSNRYRRLVELGLVPDNLDMMDLPLLKEWSTSPPEKQAYRAKQMALYAAMLKRMAQNIERLGEKGSYTNYGPTWANVSMTPFSWYNGSSYEGGLRSPLIVHYPSGIQTNVTTHAFSYVSDIAPTILDFAGLNNASNPDKISMMGKSQLNLLMGETQELYSPDEAVG